MREIEKLSSKFFCSILYLAKEGEVKRFIPFFFFFFLVLCFFLRSYLSCHILMDSTNEDASLPFRLFAINQCLSSR